MTPPRILSCSFDSLAVSGAALLDEELETLRGPVADLGEEDEDDDFVFDDDDDEDEDDDED